MQVLLKTVREAGTRGAARANCLRCSSASVICPVAAQATPLAYRIIAVVTQYRSWSPGSGASMISRQRPNRMSACIFIGTNPSSQSAIGGTGIRSRSSVIAAASWSAAARAVRAWPRNIAP